MASSCLGGAPLCRFACTTLRICLWHTCREKKQKTSILTGTGKVLKPAKSGLEGGWRVCNGTAVRNPTQMSQTYAVVMNTSTLIPPMPRAPGKQGSFWSSWGCLGGVGCMCMASNDHADVWQRWRQKQAEGNPGSTRQKVRQVHKEDMT